MTAEQKRRVTESMAADPDFRAEMQALAELSASAESPGAVFAAYDFCGHEIMPPGPTVWRWLDVAKSPMAPGGDITQISDGDLVLALAIICQGREAIKHYLSMPMRIRRADEITAAAIAAAVESETIENAYQYCDRFDATVQEIADFVVRVLQDNAPVTVKKNSDDAMTNGSANYTPLPPQPCTSSLTMSSE